MSLEADDDPKAYRWHIYYVTVSILFWIVAFGGYGLTEFGILIQGTTPMEVVLPLVGFPLMVVSLGLHIKCFFAYREDARYLKNTNSDYQPNWIFWAVMHWLFYFFAAIAYVDHRRSKIDTSIIVGYLQNTRKLISKSGSTE